MFDHVRQTGTSNVSSATDVGNPYFTGLLFCNYNHGWLFGFSERNYERIGPRAALYCINQPRMISHYFSDDNLNVFVQVDKHFFFSLFTPSE